MKLLTMICAPALMLGAAALVTPAMADQTNVAAGAQENANSSTTTQPAQNANAGSAQPAQNADNSALSAQQSSQQSAMNGQGGQSSNTSTTSSSGNTQMAMNTTGNAADLSSIPDTRHKYTRAKRNADNRSEDQTTKELNQKESSLSGSGNAQ